MIYYHPPKNLVPEPGKKFVPELQNILDRGPVFSIVLDHCLRLEKEWKPLGSKCDGLIVKATRGFFAEKCDLGALVTTLWSNASTEWPVGLSGKEEHGLLFIRSLSEYSLSSLPSNTRHLESQENLFEAMKKLYVLAYDPIIRTAAKKYKMIEDMAGEAISKSQSVSQIEAVNLFRQDVKLGLHLRRITGVSPHTIRALYEFNAMVKQWK